ncbi:type VI secretion system-associated protein TagF [Methylovirgula sp. 4M-Z18]|uniref:type VI secretion system-associated protein TagF n=1 Tax=Methylovirgula sp. 4M-Z18 TaxID=2293567 RepID=UPI00131418FC|nr:type VI secretion system-associated protein TagF [Methylovirgula sp. 4M-Z18]
MTIPCAMFGKLPSKRDFVAYNMVRPFLDQWEAWLQAGVASSRHTLGRRWQEIFLGFPIWRFWCGRQIFGDAVTGALMPSVDGVGRYFPLTVCACEPADMYLEPPPSPALDHWHEDCERFLLHMLDDHIEREPSALLAELSFPPVAPRLPAPQRNSGLFEWPGGDISIPDAFRSLEMADGEARNGGRSYWWTYGGEGGHQARLVVVEGKPSAQFFEYLMTGESA